MVVTSRVGRKPVTVPKGVEVRLDGNDFHAKGPKGQIKISIHPAVKLHVEQGNVVIQLVSDKDVYCRRGTGARLRHSIAGTVRSLVANTLTGVSGGFERRLTLVGVGYRAQIKGTELHLAVGYSHPVALHMPEGITAETPSQTEVVIRGVDRHLVGHVASLVRRVRPPEPYKGKGIRYANEKIELKETKKK